MISTFRIEQTFLKSTFNAHTRFILFYQFYDFIPPFDQWWFVVEVQVTASISKVFDLNQMDVIVAMATKSNFK